MNFVFHQICYLQNNNYIESKLNNTILLLILLSILLFLLIPKYVSTKKNINVEVYYTNLYETKGLFDKIV